MSDPNILGAPTEGLGQNVTFSFDPRNGVPQLSIPSAGGVRAGTQGSPVAGGLQLSNPQMQQPRSGVVDMLMKMGDAALTRKLEKAKTEQFVAGMQRAMTGEAVGDIVKDQPWYATLFGDTAVVEGARAYAQHANVTEALSKIEEDMPKLRELAGEDAKKYFAETVQKSLTGDAPTDAALFQAYARTMPGVMRRQVKEHYGWKQEQAAVQHDRAVMSMAKRLQAIGPAHVMNYVNDGELGQLRDELLQLTRPAEGENEASWQKRVGGQLRRMGEAGQLHALNTFLDAGVLDVLDEQGVAQVNAARARGEGQLRRQYEEQWGDRIIEVYSRAASPDRTGASTAELLAQVDGMNAEYRKMTGAKEGIFSADERRALGTRSVAEILAAEDRKYAEVRRASEKAQGREEKLAAEQQRDAQILSDARTGKLNRNPESQQAKDLVLTTVLEAQPPEKRAAMLAQIHMRSDHIVKPIAQDLQAGVRRLLAGGKVDEDMIMPVYQQFLQLHKLDPITARAYYGEHAESLVRFHKGMTQFNGTVPLAIGAFNERPPKGNLNKDELKKTLSQVRSSFDSWLPGWVPGVTNLRPGQPEIAESLIGRDIESAIGTYGPEGIKFAVEQAKRAGDFEVAGGYVIPKDRDQRSLAEYLTRPRQYTGRAEGIVPFGTDQSPDDLFAKAIDMALYGDPSKDKAGVIPQDNLFGRTADSVRIFRMKDVNGVPQFWVHAISDGKDFNTELSGDKLFALRDAAKTAGPQPLVSKPLLDIQPGYESPIEKTRRERLAAERQRK